VGCHPAAIADSFSANELTWARGAARSTIDAGLPPVVPQSQPTFFFLPGATITAVSGWFQL
jgi:hypothetical protein